MNPIVERTKSAVSIADLLAEKGIMLRHGRCVCPLHTPADNPTSFSVQGDYFRCYSCQKFGDVIRLTQLLYNLDFRDALKYLCEKAGIEFEEKQSKWRVNRYDWMNEHFPEIKPPDWNKLQAQENLKQAQAEVRELENLWQNFRQDPDAYVQTIFERFFLPAFAELDSEATFWNYYKNHPNELDQKSMSK